MVCCTITADKGFVHLPPHRAAIWLWQRAYAGLGRISPLLCPEKAGSCNNCIRF